MNTYDFRIVRYEGGKLAWMTDSANSYPTREAAIKAAQDQGEYWSHFHKNAEFQKTLSGAVLWFIDSEGRRCRTEYKVNELQ